jgi:hypothetical protein
LLISTLWLGLAHGNVNIAGKKMSKIIKFTITARKEALCAPRSTRILVVMCHSLAHFLELQAQGKVGGLTNLSIGSVPSSVVEFCSYVSPASQPAKCELMFQIILIFMLWSLVVLKSGTVVESPFLLSDLGG